MEGQDKVVVLNPGIQEENPDNIPTELISSVNVIKGPDAIAAYGDQAKNSAIVLALNKTRMADIPAYLQNKLDTKAIAEGEPVGTPLYVLKIEGQQKEITLNPSIEQENPDNLPVELISSMYVVKGPDAVAAYGDQAKNGVAVLQFNKHRIKDIPEYFKERLGTSK